MLSIAIPSRNEIFLEKTIRDVLANATGEIEVFPILDGYEPPASELVDDPRVHYLRIPLGDGACHKRHGVNMMVDQCHGEYVMSLDAHCMVGKGFDEILARDHQPNWIQIPRRNRLDAENWCIQVQSDSRPPIDYEHFMYQYFSKGAGLHGFRWDERTYDRADVMIDDTATFQGSCWFMTKDWFKERGFMQIEGYTGWGQEAEELGLETWYAGGAVKTNKNTWYAHLHKGAKYGRMYFQSKSSRNRCDEYAYNHLFLERKDKFIALMEKFNTPKLQPGWPENWKEQLEKIN